MESFTYKGIAEGKYVEGEIEALNQDEASHKLKEQKVIITNLVRSKKKKGEAKAKGKGGGFSLFGKKKVKVEEILIFSKQFATMVKAGLPILQVLVMLRDQLESPAIKEAILRKAQTPELREIAIKEGFQTMHDKGRRMIANGELNFREYERVLST